MVKQVESNLFTQTPGSEIDLYLPYEIIELMEALKLQERCHPTGQSDELEVDIIEAEFSRPLLYTVPVFSVCECPNLVETRDLDQHVPTQYVFTAREAGLARWATSKCAGQNILSAA
jgi:hypothetical protein